MLFLLLSLNYFSPGTDKIEGQFYNPIKIINRYPAPTGIKDIREKYPNYTVPLENYSYPGQTKSLTVDEAHQIYDECRQIHADFGRNDLGPNDQYRHPAGVRQFLNVGLDRVAEEEKKILEAERVDIETIINPNYAHRHLTGLYIPPGELVTIGLPKSVQGEVFVNRQAFNEVARDVKFNKRINIIRKEFQLKYPKTTIVWPYGGTIALAISQDKIPDEGLKIIIRGCIQCPVFRLGIHTDEDWQNMLKLPGPFTYIDTGNLHIYSPTFVARKYSKVNDALHFYRSVEAFYDSCAPSDDGVLENGRDPGAIDMLSDVYMQYGAAYAYSSLRNVIMPHDWVDAFLTKPERQGNWGVLHELGHNHQANWGCGYTAEVTNNALIVNVYIRQTTISSLRKLKSDGTFALGSGAQWTTQPYFVLTAGRESNGDLQLLAFWSILPHYFGTDKFHDYVYAETRKLLFDYNKYKFDPQNEANKAERCYYTMCMTFKRNMYEHFSNFKLIPENFNSQVKSDIDAMNFRVFHPVSCPYACGYYQDDGKPIITARPYRIIAGKEFTFDFEKYKAEENDKNYFTFTRMENVKHPENFRQGSSRSEFIYTPLDDVLAVDSFDVVYTDSTDNTETKMVVQIEQDFKGVRRRIWYKKGIPSNAKSGLPYYQEVRDKQPEVDEILPQTNFEFSYRRPNGGGDDGYVIEYSAIWISPLNGRYFFSVTRDGYPLFFISENPITDDDEVLNMSSAYNVYWHDSKIAVNLEFNKAYYVRFVIVKHQYSSEGHIGYQSADVVPANDWDRPRISADDLIIDMEHYQLEQQREPFKPIYTFPVASDLYAKQRNIPSYVNRSKLQYDKNTAPPGDFGSLENLFDGDKNTLNGGFISKFKGPVAPYPHRFDYNFSDVIPISGATLYMPNINVNNKEQGINGTIRFLCNGSTTLYDGPIELYVRNPHEPFKVSFKKSYKCQTLNMSVIENHNCIYNPDAKCVNATAFSELEIKGDTIYTDKIIPTTHHFFAFTNDEDVTYGHYFNGKAKHISTGGTIRISVRNVKELVMLCDRIKDAPIARGIININGKYADQFSTAINPAQDHFDGNGRVYQRGVSHIILDEPMEKAKVEIIVTEGDIYFNGLLTDGIPIEPLPDPTNSPVPTPIETTPTEIIIEDKNLTEDRYSISIADESSVIVNIKSTNFTGINHEGNGGAIYVENAGFNCTKADFANCNSTAGGGIYLSYSYDYTNSYKLDGITFKQCSAQSGGAIYLYSSSVKNLIEIIGCQFMNNIASQTESNENMHGGSAIFMSAKSGEIRSNKLINNHGDSDIRIHNNFNGADPNSKKSKLLQEAGILISDCEFENSKDSNGCIYYFLGNESTSFEVRSCTFSGELEDGTYYIDGKAASENGKKLTVKKCTFATDIKRAINLDSNCILADQNFGPSGKKSSNTWKIVVGVLVAAVAIVIIVLVVVFVVKKKKRSESSDFIGQNTTEFKNDTEPTIEDI